MKKQKNILLLAIQDYFSYISIALMCCSLIGLTIFWSSVFELNEASKETECAKLRGACSTLEDHVLLLEDVRDDICTTMLYAPAQLFSINRDSFAYREIELLEHLSGYQTYSPLCSNYFLYYLGTNHVYTNTAKIFFNSYFSTPRNDLFSDNTQIDELKQFFNTAGFSSRGILRKVKNDTYLMIFPLRLTYSTVHPNAILGFVITKQDLLNLICPTSDYFAGDISVSYLSTPLFGGGQMPNAPLDWQDGIAYSGDNIISQSPKGYITVYDTVFPDTWNAGLHSYRTFTYLFLFIAIVVVAILTILFAYKKYLPIHRTSKKLQAMMPDKEIGGKNQLKQIEDAVSIVFMRSHADKQQIQTQMEQLKHQERCLKDQALMLVLSGNTAWLNQSQLSDIGIDLSGSFFRVFVLRFETAIPDYIFAEIEKLSDEDQHYCPVKVSDEEVAVISSFFLERTADDGSAFLQELAVSHGEHLFTVTSNLTVDRLEKLAASYYSAKNTGDTPPVAHLDETNEDYTHFLLLLLKSLREGSSQDAYNYLSLLTDYISQKCSSFLIQKCVIADVVSQLSRFSQDINMPIDAPEIGATLIYRDLDSIFKSLKSIIDRLVSQIQLQNEETESDIALRIKAYIDTNAFDYNCSLQQISSHFKLSPKQINSFLKEVTGLGYKDYEVSIRIKKAHTLLADTSISVASISEQIGYTDVSSFIKAFKKVIGLTPAEYRKKYYSFGSK